MGADPGVTRRHAIQAGGALGAALLLGACSSSGGAPSQSGGSGTKPGGATSLADLEAAAKKEGGDGLFYINGDITLAKVLGNGFKKTYPWSNATATYIDNTVMQSKIITENVTGAQTADVFMLPQVFRQQLISHDLPAATHIPRAPGIPVDILDSTGYAYPCYQLFLGIIYNTRLIRPAALPRTIADLADPAWKGKLALDRPQDQGTGPTYLGAQAQLMGMPAWLKWLDGLKANNLFITDSGGDTYTAIQRGERAIGISGSSNDISSQPKGAPVAGEWTQYRPVKFVQYNWLNTKAAHPNTGRLFIYWMMTDAGQRAFASTGRTPVLPTVQSPVSADRVLPPGANVLPGTVLTDFYHNTQTYLNAMFSRWPS